MPATKQSRSGGCDPTPGSVSSVKVEVAPEEWNDGGEYCIMQPQNPDWSLCGLHLPDDAGLDDDEVPDEITCADCLAIRAREGPQNAAVDARRESTNHQQDG